MMNLKDKLAAQIPAWRERVGSLIQEHGDTVVGEVTIRQVYGGMRGVKSLVSDISYVDPNEGIRLRGYTIPEALKLLPKSAEAEIPLVGGLYYLLLTGEIPSYEEALQVESEWKARSAVPDHVFKVLMFMSEKASPMNLFSTAIMSLEADSLFTAQYNQGMRKEEYWEPMLEDSLDLIAKLPTIAAFIYRMKHGMGPLPPANPDLDWAGNFAHMMDIPQVEYQDLSRLYFIIHADHESGNVSAHATHMVASTLSNIYYAASAGMNGLAGPLHGRANQENLRWLFQVYDRYGRVPSKEELTQYAWDTLNAGQVIPGYGHAVLRRTDPRYSALYEFGKKYIKNDPIFELASLIYEVVPPVLMEQGKAKNPWPNVDAISGAVQHHYGVIDECDPTGGCGFYTVLFGVSRVLGVSANAIWARALGQPIERPKSLTTAMLEEIAARK
jgi:citrate synthase